MRWSIAILAAGSLHAATLYNVVALPGYGGTSSIAAAVNAAGMAAVNATTEAGVRVTYSQGFNMTQGELYADAGAGRINDGGAVVGTSYGDSGPRATVWSNGVANEILNYQSYGMGINNAGDLAGARRAGSTLTAFVSTYNGMADIATGGKWSSANDISNTRNVAGTLQTTGGQFRAFAWNQSAGTTQIGTLGGANSYGNAVAEGGDVAGSAQTSQGYLHAFLYNGTMKDLGTLGGTTSAAYDVNASGSVVGFSYDGASRSRAFIWYGGVMFDLNALLRDASGWTLEAAYGINDSGQIVGSGTFNGQATAFRLDPATVRMSALSLSDSSVASSAVPEPSTLFLASVGGLSILLLRFRRTR